MAANSTDGALAGAADCIRKLQALGALDNGKIALGAVRAGIQPAFTAAEAKIPVGTRMHRTYKGRLVAPGFGKRSLVIVTTKKTNDGLPSALLGVRGEAYYETQFLERGTSKMRAQPWLRSSFYSTQDAMEAAMVAYLQKRLAKLAKDGTP